MVTINGRPYKTEIDEYGNARFVPNNLIQKIKMQFGTTATAMSKLCAIGAITPEELVEYYAGTGCTVAFIYELPVFKNLSIIEHDAN